MERLFDIKALKTVSPPSHAHGTASDHGVAASESARAILDRLVANPHHFSQDQCLQNGAGPLL